MRSSLRSPHFLLPAVLALTFALLPPQTAQSTFDVTGRWTSPTDSGANWGFRQIHLALLRGDDSAHSYVLSWHFNTPTSFDEGGLWRWNPPEMEDEYGSYPLGTFAKAPSAEQPNSPGADIFCSGHAPLAGGRGLFLAGGHEGIGTLGDVNGIREAYIYDLESRDWDSPDPEAMTYRRYYPTVTTLASGELLVTHGWEYHHLLTFGGRTNPSSATSSRRSIERLEPSRDSRRLQSLRGWSHAKTESVLPRGPGTGGTNGPGSRRAV